MKENPAELDPSDALRRCLSCKKKFDDPSKSSPSLMRKNVSFHEIEISQYPIEIGDNPSANGAPLTIGWDPQSKFVFDLEAYESVKPKPREGPQLLIPPKIRKEMLLSNGTTMRELIEVTREQKKIQIQRSNSVDNMKWDRVNFALEKTRRKIKKVTSLVSLSRTSSMTRLMDNPPHKVASSVPTQETEKGTSLVSFARTSSMAQLMDTAPLSPNDEESSGPIMF